MTDQDQAVTTVQEAADAPAPEVAAEVAKVTQAAQEPVTDALRGSPRAPLEPEAPKGLNPLDPEGPDAPELDDEVVSYHQLSNPNSLRGVPAGPPPHPRTV